MSPKKSLPAGVVTGQEYFDLVEQCKQGQYALAAVNVTNSSVLNAVLEAAGESKTDVIIQLSNGGAQFYAGKGLQSEFDAKVLGAVAAAQHVHLLAQHYGVCVILHTDHANKKLIPWVEALLAHGEQYFEKNGRPLFSSHMLDLSEEPLDWNINECKRILERMARMNMSIEIELGVTGGEEDGVGSDIDESADNSHLYTQPEDVLQAYETLKPIGHFSVAASFGNVHGVYKPGNVKLRPEILKNSQALVQEKHKTAANPLNLVFHGGSGSEKEKIKEALTYGVFKMNIDTDTQFAFAQGAAKSILAEPQAFKHQIDPDSGKPYKKIYDPRQWLRDAEVSMKKRLFEAFDDLDCKGKSLAQA